MRSLFLIPMAAPWVSCQYVGRINLCVSVRASIIASTRNRLPYRKATGTQMLQSPSSTSVAYFCMEVGVARLNMPTYGGGLGVLAGDTLQNAADLRLPMVGMTLLYRDGYLRQSLDADGQQLDSAEPWDIEAFLELVATEISVPIGGRTVRIRAWRQILTGIGGNEVSVYFLDTDMENNHADDRALTGRLYGGDVGYRLCQEALLGIGGVVMLRALGFTGINVYHMNEGHSALIALPLLEAELAGKDPEVPRSADIDAVRGRCVFTTHTPVPAAMDRYPWPMVEHVLGRRQAHLLELADCRGEDGLNMTRLALRFSRYVNGVAMRHSEVSRGMFPHYPINSVSNGVHAATWTSPPFADLFDRYIPEWRRDNQYLRYAIGIPLDQIERAHSEAKDTLIAEVGTRTGQSWSSHILTIGFARRATAYKRADLLFADTTRLQEIADQFGGLQIVLAGRAHPEDAGGKALIRRIFHAIAQLGDAVRVVYLENYDLPLAQILVAGSDVWLNTPLRPNEASGTSGMKAAMNGVPSLSILDGWWVEGHVEGVTGWSIGEDGDDVGQTAEEVASLYDKLQKVILPVYSEQSDRFTKIMRSCIALNASYFNTQRMLAQYVSNAYSLGNRLANRSESPCPPLMCTAH